MQVANRSSDPRAIATYPLSLKAVLTNALARQAKDLETTPIRSRIKVARVANSVAPVAQAARGTDARLKVAAKREHPEAVPVPADMLNAEESARLKVVMRTAHPEVALIPADTKIAPEEAGRLKVVMRIARPEVAPIPAGTKSANHANVRTRQGLKVARVRDPAAQDSAAETRVTASARPAVAMSAEIAMTERLKIPISFFSS